MGESKRYYVSISEETVREAAARTKAELEKLTENNADFAINLVHQLDELENVCESITRDKERAAQA